MDFEQAPGGQTRKLHRANMIPDGALVLVPVGVAREAGLSVPVAFAATTYQDHVVWTAEDSARMLLTGVEPARLQTQRLGAVLRAAALAAGRRHQIGEVRFEVKAMSRDGIVPVIETVVMVMKIEADESGQLAATIMDVAMGREWFYATGDGLENYVIFPKNLLITPDVIDGIPAVRITEIKRNGDPVRHTVQPPDEARKYAKYLREIAGLEPPGAAKLAEKFRDQADELDCVSDTVDELACLARK